MSYGPATITMTLEGMAGGGWRIVSQSITIARDTSDDERQRQHREARGPGKRRKVPKLPYAVSAPVTDYRTRRLTAWCRDNAVGNWNLADTYRDEAVMRFQLEEDAILFQLFSGGVAA